MIADANASLVYLVLRQVLQMLTQLARDGGAKDVELLVLRRQVHRPDLQPIDRVVLARLLPRERWSVFFVTPATLLRWHRQRIARVGPTPTPGPAAHPSTLTCAGSCSAWLRTTRPGATAGSRAS